MADGLPSPWEASRPILVVYGLTGVGVWLALGVLTEYSVIEGLPVGLATVGLLWGAELQAGYRIRWAMGRIRDVLGGPTQARTPQTRVLELEFLDRPVTVRGQTRNFRVFHLEAEVDGDRRNFPPRKADEVAKELERSLGER